MRRVALFARRPVAGKVKTRLSPALPPQMACALYEGMLADAVSAVRGSRLADERFVYWAEAGSVGDAGGLAERVQVGGDLGERLIAAFDELILEPGDHAVVIGADCPMLGAEAIDEAFQRLAWSEAVVAPVSDGGYALVGLAARAPAMFRGIEWSTERVFEQSRMRADATGIALTTLGTFEDIDTAEDVCRLVGSLAADSTQRGRATRQALIERGVLPA